MEKQNKNEQKSAKKPRFSRTWKALTILISLLIVYTGYHVFFGLSESVRTTAAGLVEQSSSVMLEGVIFRTEETVSTSYKGDMRPYYANGERVTTDALVADVYSDSTGKDTNARIDGIKEKIDILERSNVRGLVSIVDIEKLNAEIDKIYTSIMLAVSNNENYKVAALERELTVCLNKMRIYRGEVKNYNAEIEWLISELEILYSSFSGNKESIYADKGGYFYHSCDGYENILTPEKLASLTPESLSELVSSTKENPRISTSATCKFVYDSTWTIATVCDEATALLLEVDNEYTVTLFDTKERELKVTLEQIGEIKNGSCVLLFSCPTMPEGFDYSRYQSFKLDISSIEGYRVPIEALVTVKDEAGNEITGVYILNASVVHFRRVDEITMGNGYYIVEKFDKSKENYQEYLNLNDLIILEPDGMFDGKILKK